MDSNNKDFDKFIRRKADQIPNVPEDLNLDWENMDLIPEGNPRDLTEILLDKFVKEETKENPTIDPALGLEWDNMNITINKKKSKRRFVLWLILLSLSIISLLVITKYLNKTEVDKNIVSVQESHVPIITSELNNDDGRSTKKSESSAKNKSFSDLKISENKNNISTNSTLSKVKTAINDSQQNEKPTQSRKKINPKTISSIQTNRSVTTKFTKEIEDNIESFTHQYITIDSSASDPNKFITIANKQAIYFDFLPGITTGLLKSKSTIQIKNIDSLIPPFAKQDNEEGRSVYFYALAGQNFGRHTTEVTNSLSSKVGTDLGKQSQVGFVLDLSTELKVNSGIKFTQIHSTLSESREISSELLIGTSTVRTTCLHFYHNNFSNYIGLYSGLDYNILKLGDLTLDLGVSLSASKLFNHDFTILSMNNTLLKSSTPLADVGLNISVTPNITIKYNLTSHISLLGYLQSDISLLNKYFITDSSSMDNLYSLNIGIGYSLKSK